MQSIESHSLHSTLRERIVEHVFVGEALRCLWRHGIADVEVLRSEFDAGGYDIVMSRGDVVRHIQFKSVYVDGKAARTSVNLNLSGKPSGCIIWVVVTRELELSQFLWFGGAPGEPLPSLDGFAVTKHTKGNSDGVKAERPNHRIIPRGRFTVLSSINDALVRLFGPLTPGTPLEPEASLP